MMKFIELVRVNDKELKNAVKGAFILANGNPTNGDIAKAVEHLKKGLKPWQEISAAQIQDACSWLRYSPRMAKFRAMYGM